MVKSRAIGILLALALAICGACHSSRSTNRHVKFTFANLSTNTFDSVQLVWDGPKTFAGTLAPPVYKTIFGLPWPNLTKAKLTFVDDKTSQPHSIDLSFPELNDRIQTGKCGQVILRILDYDKAEMTCE
jgi:hypothetical protein